MINKMAKTGKDLGTYHVKVIFHDNTGFIDKWSTSGRFICNGNSLDSTWLDPTFKNEEEVIELIEFKFAENSCDCNLKRYLDQAYNREEKHHECGYNLQLKELIIINPSGEVIKTFQYDMDGVLKKEK